ncbi:MAG: hypothetical protein RLZZ113_1696 [Pseudomonadota bacterium]
MAIKTIGVIGAGTMGSGIAQAFSAKGLKWHRTGFFSKRV